MLNQTADNGVAAESHGGSFIVTPGNQRAVEEGEKDVCHDYEDVLNLIGFGKTQWIVLLTTGLLLMTVIDETVGFNIIIVASQCDFDTNSVEKAVLSAASLAGIVSSSYFWGYLSDSAGRRAILVYSTLAGNFFSFMSIFVPYYWGFVLLRFMVGLFYAGASSTSYAYLGEFHTPRIRPVVINYASMFVGISLVYVPAVAWLILSMNWELVIAPDVFVFRPWRLLIIFSFLPGFIGACTLLILPESPKFLLSRQRDEEALAVIDHICMSNIGKHVSELKVHKLKSEMLAVDNRTSIDVAAGKTCGVMSKMLHDTRPLFQRPHRLNFAISCLAMSGLFLCSTGMGLWYPEIQNRLGLSGNEKSVCQVIEDSHINQQQNYSETAQICNDDVTRKSLIDSLWLGTFFVAGFVILGVVINPLGRKVVMIGALSISFACGIALRWVLQPAAIVVCFCLFMMLPSLCVSVLSGAVVDLVPTHLRGKAVCICLMLGRCGAIVGSNIIGALLEQYCQLTFGIFCGIVFTSGVLTLLLPI